MITRAIQLIQLSRYEMAEQELRRVLAQNPQDFFAHAYLGFCQLHQDKLNEAEQSAKQAIGLCPDHPFGHYVLGHTYLQQRKYKEAKNALLEAIRLDPEESEYHGILGYVYLSTGQHKEALECADKGLSLDPTDLTCKNCKAKALTHLGRMDQAHSTIKDALKDDPENAWTFANLGWTHLHQGKHKEALVHFKEALRLEPDNEWAREGMIHALKANYLVYKLLLMFYLWMQRLSPKVRTGVIIGLVAGMKFMKHIAIQNPELKPIFIPFLAIYMIFIYLTWTGTHFFNTLLRFNKFGRCVLNDQERNASNCYAGLITAGVTSVIVGLIFDLLPVMLLGGFFVLMTIPFCHLFDQDDQKQKQKVSLFCIVLSVLGILGVIGVALDSDLLGGIAGMLFLVVFIIFTWLGAFKGSLRQPI